METQTLKSILVAGSAGALMSIGFFLGDFNEKSKHRNDNIEISLTRNIGYYESKNEPNWEVEASIGGRKFRIPSLQCYFSNAGLDKAASERTKSIEDLEYSSKLIKRDTSIATFGERGGDGRPCKEINYEVQANYRNWEEWGYGSGFVSSVNFRPD
ncbi:MAG: hypothetical protein PHH54_00735 [Candidatus Nanoarchaeia archaeon]|nr:hypothetical protein [Candidatus Nanoarchaeia archaeon]MDD5740488.1 hypothetical protein [Candidatus Nanoarchaeia archaeon]